MLNTFENIREANIIWEKLIKEAKAEKRKKRVLEKRNKNKKSK